MGDYEDYTFSSAAKRKPKKLRIKKTNNMSDNDDDDAVGTSDESRSSTPSMEPAAASSPAEAYFPSRQISPSSLKDSPETQRRQLAFKMSRLKRYDYGDEAIPAVTTLTSGNSLLDLSPVRNSGNGSSNRAASFLHTNPQEDSRSRNVQQGKSVSSSIQDFDASLQFTTMEEDENYSDSDDSDIKRDDVEDEDYEEEALEEDGTLAKAPTQRYEKYRSVLGRSSSNDEMWEKPKSKLGAPPSFDYDPSQQRQKASMFGGASHVESSAYKLPPGALDGAKPEKSKSRKNARDSPVPESSILDKEDLATLTMMLLGDDSSDDDDDDMSDGVSFPFKDDGGVIVLPKTADLTNADSNQVQAAMSDDVDMAHKVHEEVSYHSSEVPMSEQGERAYELEAGHGYFKEGADMLTFQEEDEVSQVEEDDHPNHPAVMGVAAIAGAAAVKRSSQRDVEEVIESTASERDEPSKSTYEQSEESMAPVSKRIDPAKKERETRKSEASAIAAAVAASGYKSNLVHKEVEKPAPKREPKVERMVQLNAVPKPNPQYLNDSKNQGGFLDAEVAKDPLARKRMSQYNRDQRSKVSDNIMSTEEDDDDNFSDIWEQSVVEENKGRLPSTRATEYSDEASFASRNTEASSLRKNAADSTANLKNEGDETEGFPDVSSKATGEDRNASSRTGAKGAGEEADSQANERNGGKEAAAGYALASTTRPPADTPQDRTFQKNESDSMDSSEGSMSLDFAKGAGEEADSHRKERNGGKEAAAGVAAGYALASTTRPPADTPQDRTFQKNESDSMDNSEGSMSIDFAKGAGEEADSHRKERNGGKEAAAGVAAGYALASTTRPPADTPQDRTFQKNQSDGVDSSEGSMSLDFGNGPLQTDSGNGPLQTDDDDNSMDSFSLGASKDIEALATSKYDEEEYKPKRSRSKVSPSLDDMEAMNTGMMDFDGLSDDDLGKMETGPVVKSNKTSAKETKSSSATALRKPTFYSGAQRNCVRGTMILLLLAAGAVPAYFLITEHEARADKDIQSVNLFGPLPTASPSQNPVVNTMQPQPQPTTTPVSPAIQPVAPAPTPSPTAVTPLPTTQSPSTQPGTPTASPSHSPSLRPSTLSPTLLPTMNPVEFLEKILTAASPDLQSAFADTTSPQYSALLWLSTYSDLFKSPEIKIIQRFALAIFYLTTGGTTWANNDSWLTDVDECLWYSSNIAPCDFMGLFVNLELELNNIGGALPSELSLLSNSLTRIDLTRTRSEDFLSGPIPPEFGQLTKLEYFSLRGNQITGSLPPTLGQWTLLEVADLSNNLLSGPLPEATGMLSQLSILDLDGNQFSGPIPTSIGRLTKIRNLSIANNRLTGPIPSEIGRLFLLEDLHLEQNELTTLPAELGNLILLRFFSVSENNVTGLLPPQIGSLINVLTLDLSDNALSGTIPTEMGSLFLIRGMLSICVASFSLFYRSSL
jgi:hypothetical protein